MSTGPMGEPRPDFHYETHEEFWKRTHRQVPAVPTKAPDLLDACEGLLTLGLLTLMSRTPSAREMFAPGTQGAHCLEQVRAAIAAIASQTDG